jgi:hypothetical protein
MAATLADELLKQDQRGAAMPMVDPRHYVVAINESALARRGLELPQIYETFARTTFTYVESTPGAVQ